MISMLFETMIFNKMIIIKGKYINSVTVNVAVNLKLDVLLESLLVKIKIFLKILLSFFEMGNFSWFRDSISVME